MLFRFKICFTNPSVTYDVPDDWTVEYTFARIRDYLCDDFDIPNTFHLIPGPLFQNIGYMGIAERHPPFDMRGDEHRLLSNYFNFGNSVHMFYIRPMEELDGAIERASDLTE
jgi:hypothetical protein